MTETTRTVNGNSLPLPGTYSIDLSHSALHFSVRHMMVSKVRGSFDAFSGSITIAEDPTASSVNVEVDLNSINTNDETRDGHLKSADFFNTETTPKMTFVSTSVQPKGDDWLVTGDLTIAGTTKSTTLEVEFEGATVDPWGNLRIGFSASGGINREEFGVSWNQALETGGVLVGKDIKITIDAEAVTPVS
ncbi:MAG: YceI family protein [Actinobacteria bacterium]|nr:YceI family protein [Actinomycetota bacterium]